MEDTGSVDVGPQARQGHAPERDKRHEVALEADVTESPRQGGAVPEKERGYDSRDPASGQAGNRLVEHVLPLFGEGHVDHLGHRGLRVYLRGRVECEHNRIGDGAMREALEPIDAALLDSSARPRRSRDGTATHGGGNTSRLTAPIRARRGLDVRRRPHRSAGSSRSQRREAAPPPALRCDVF